MLTFHKPIIIIFFKVKEPKAEAADLDDWEAMVSDEDKGGAKATWQSNTPVLKE